ncbi:CLUMA_CG017442, isoform A [Clunio marinus]|uniref:CLUMA_CG017442, isoform A n=1 Tax=Clunio marinus TaxID=568069 RepID=A0A1J1IVW4_9DIPT|nr:CLUMA_CG017442, isoform A [Clunio marinus]
MKLFLLFVIIDGLSSVVVCEKQSNGTECIKSFLKLEVLDENCTEIVSSYKENFHQEIANQMFDISEESVKSCIINIFNDSNVFQLFLKGLSSHSDEQIKLSKETMDSFVGLAKEICTGETKFKEEFDLFSGKNKLPSAIPLDEQCARKYFIEKNIINAKDFDIDVSSISDENCEAYNELYIKAFEREHIDHHKHFFGSSNTSIQNCIKQKFRDEKVYLNLHATALLMKYELTPSQADDLRRNYVKWKTAYAKILFQCIKDDD